LAEAETSIIKMIQLSDHLIEMDYPVNKGLQALDDFNSFGEESKWKPDFVKSFQTDNIWETI
jgi:hypothetical protein